MKDLHKDNRKYCKKCGAVLGENVDGKPICICEVWSQECEKKLGNTVNVKLI